MTENEKEYYKDKTDCFWRTSFKVEDYFEKPEAWQDRITLPKWANEFYQAGFKGISAEDFYDILFDDSDIAEKGKIDKKTYCPKLVRLFPDPSGKLKKDGTPEMKSYMDYVFAGKENLMNNLRYSDPSNFIMIKPVSFAGGAYKNADEYARVLHAIVFEIDDLIEDSKKTGFNNLVHAWENDSELSKLPRPTMLVCSGSGVHLYFVLDKPIALFPNIKEQLAKMRLYFLRKFWVTDVSKKKLEAEGLTQNYRCVGSYAKNHESLVTAFEIGPKVSLDYLNSFIPDDQPEAKVTNLTYRRKGFSLEQAKKLWPEWYEERVVGKRAKGTWYVNDALYHWWKKVILDQATEGCRFFMVENLCSLAVKCQIEEQDLDRDLEFIYEELKKRTFDGQEPFTYQDIEAAKTTYERKSYNAFARRVDYLREKYRPFGVVIPERRRNGRSQEKHLAMARFARDLNGKDWRNKNGAPTKQAIVQEWRKNNPTGKKADCVRETGLDKKTVYKWWGDDIVK